MQTQFAPEELKDPRIEEANSILRKCVHCGLCTATCPTYVVLGDERDSPRGRIYLIKDMLENAADREPTIEARKHIDRCLSCLSCTTACPSGVDYMHLIDLTRVHLEERRPPPPATRFIRSLLAAIIPYPSRFRRAVQLANLARPARGIFKRLGLTEFAAMLDLAPPRLLPSRGRFSGPGVAVTKTERVGRVILHTGCVQSVLRPEINDATIKLLARRGVDVIVANGAGCCGAAVHHLGKERHARDLARQNIDAWTKEIERGELTAIISTASGCGTTLKDYGHMFRNDPDYAQRAAKVSELAKDVSEFIASAKLGAAVRWSSLKVAYHSACSLQHGQGIHDEPRQLLKLAGFSVVDVPDGHLCCGSAGTYNILQPEIAKELRDRKVKAIRSTRADIVAAGNIGCITQLEPHLSIPVVHTVELLEWAYGGVVPRGLQKFDTLVTDIPKPRRAVAEFIDEPDDPDETKHEETAE